MNERKPIMVTQPYMPPLDEFVLYLNKIWGSKWLTNKGQFHIELESTLCEYLGVKHISLFANGTLALMTALRALDINGEVITTPFSFVATSHSLLWNGIRPVFVDIEPEFCNIDPDKISDAISDQTSAILPVHVYGNPCDMETIKLISEKNDLNVIYDAAHAFGVKLNNKTVLNEGHLSILSFHATKVFNTFEGGAIVCHDEVTKKKIDNLKNFGFVSETMVIGTGLNAKMNEVQAAFGLLNLKYFSKATEMRSEISRLYFQNLDNVKGIRTIKQRTNVDSNYSYFPIFVDCNEYGISRDILYERLKEKNIITRKYFYPLISQFPAYKDLPSALPENLPIATKIANEVLCLPIYPDLAFEKVEYICNIIIQNRS